MRHSLGEVQQLVTSSTFGQPSKGGTSLSLSLGLKLWSLTLPTTVLCQQVLQKLFQRYNTILSVSDCKLV